MENRILKKKTLKCPQCQTPLHFKQMYGMRLIENGFIECKCIKCHEYYTVKS